MPPPTRRREAPITRQSYHLPDVTPRETHHGRIDRRPKRLHWKERLAVRFKAAVERIKARHPALFDRLRRRAHALALESLGLAEAYAALETIQAEEAATARRKRQVQKQMVAAVRGVPIEEVLRQHQRPLRHTTCRCRWRSARAQWTKRQAAHLDGLLAEDEVGREVRRLEAEQEGLLDTWCGWRPRRHRLKHPVDQGRLELLGEGPTALEAEALAIAPPEEG